MVMPVESGTHAHHQHRVRGNIPLLSSVFWAFHWQQKNPSISHPWAGHANDVGCFRIKH